jgi:haloacetate dehalogenase
MFEGFSESYASGDGARIYVRCAGSGPAALLLHGFPESHLMWRDVAPRLAEHYSVVCADVRGYGNSDCPPSDEQHAAYSKRTMARDMVSVMDSLGFREFAVAGHDRGARVAYRLALDAPAVVTRLAVLDAIPVTDAWNRADANFALSFWPWSLLAQAAPLPERLIAGNASAIVENATTSWGSPHSVFPREVTSSYANVLRDPAHAHAICEEYRAAAGVDRIHDDAERDAGRRIACPVLVLWSGMGALGQWYSGDGGPLGIWRKWADDVSGRAMPGGHFFPEEYPEMTADALQAFIGRA